MEVKRISPNQFFVQSDGGELYKVSITGESKNTISCSCKGFTFRHNCKHVEEVRAIMESEGKKVKPKAVAKGTYEYITPYKESIQKVLDGAE